MPRFDPERFLRCLPCLFEVTAMTPRLDETLYGVARLRLIAGCLFALPVARLERTVEIRE